MTRNMLNWMMVIVTALALLLTVSLAVAQEATPETTPAPETATAAPAAEAAPAAAPANSGMVVGLRHLHSAVRWIVVLLALAALVKIGLVFFQGGAYDKLAQRLMIGFSVAFTVQWLLGIVFFIVYAGVVGFGALGHVWGHLTVMTIGVALSHMSPRWKKADDRTRARASLMIIVAVLVLVVIGVALLPQGWRMFPL
jgi:hypothetical protein